MLASEAEPAAKHLSDVVVDGTLDKKEHKCDDNHLCGRDIVQIQRGATIEIKTPN